MTTNLSIRASRGVINAPIDRIDLSDWAFTLPEHDYQGLSPAHLAAGFATSPEGKRMSVNLEVIGDNPMAGTLAEKDHLIPESVSDVFATGGRTKIHVLWELSVRASDTQRSEFTDHVRPRAIVRAFRSICSAPGASLCRSPTTRAKHRSSPPVSNAQP